MPTRRLQVAPLAALLLLPACLQPLPADTDSDASTTGDTGATTEPPPPTTTEPPSTDPTTAGPTADPTTDGPTADPTDPTTDEPPVGLCGRLGGADDGIPALVGAFVGKVLADDRINGYFLNADLDRAGLAGCIADQLAVLAECPGAVYRCDDMATAHFGLGISQQDHDDFVELFVAALGEHQQDHPALGAEDLAAIEAALVAPTADIVADPGGTATVYQRVGRKPAIAALIGRPDEPGSFVALVAEDAAINSFFAGADFDRLNTCLTRQVAGLDGPIKYGLEVDAPAGADPGVGLDTPCLDMMSAHAGLLDADMQPITGEDFSALIADLVTAMESAAIAPEDQAVVLGAFVPLCEQIVADIDTCPGNNKSELLEAIDLGLDLTPFDDDYDGTLASMACTELVVSDDGVNLVRDVRLTIGMAHTWAGDVTIKVVAPDDAVVTALGRPGSELMPLADDGIACCGDNSNFDPTRRFTLHDAAAISGKDMGKLPLGDDDVICKDEMPPLEPCEFRTYPGKGPGTGFVDFVGTSAVGTWKVCVGDSGMGDFGAVDYIGLTLAKVKYGP